MNQPSSSRVASGHEERETCGDTRHLPLPTYNQSFTMITTSDYLVEQLKSIRVHLAGINFFNIAANFNISSTVRLLVLVQFFWYYLCNYLLRAHTKSVLYYIQYVNSQYYYALLLAAR